MENKPNLRKKATSSTPAGFVSEQGLSGKSLIVGGTKRSADKSHALPTKIQKKSDESIPASIFTTENKRPMIAKSIASKVKWEDRQKALDKIHKEFLRIYASLKSPSLAYAHSLQQELAIYEISNQQSYNQRVIGALMRLRKRPLALNSQDTGIDGKWCPPTKDEDIPVLEVTKLILLDSDWSSLDYPVFDNVKSATSMDPIGKQRKCNRCDVTFVVEYPVSDESKTSCAYHYGRLKKGAESYFTCCRGDSYSKGCTLGPHVYLIEDDLELNDVIPFRRLPPGNGQSPNVLAMDCEMSYTVAGMEVVRVSIVDWNGKTVLDTLVQTQYPVICFNTRFSGVSSVSDGVTFEELHDRLGEIANSDTILLGHSLSSDLRALRLDHRRVIDTVQLYPHQRGHPFKNSLRYLTEKYLGRFIQTGEHNSIEDALACMDLLKLKVKSKT
jgi:RNA exonuclease 1